MSGKDEDVFVFNPTSLGEDTAGTYDSRLLFDGSLQGVGADLKAIDVSISPVTTPPLIDFRVLADVPYDVDEYSELEADLTNVDPTDQFFVHLGDITSEDSSCGSSVYSSVSSSLQTSSIPVFIVPGDNEWNDCSNPNQAWSYWDTYLMRLEDNWSHSFGVLRQSVREENFAFVHSGALFIGINLVGGSVHDATEWSQRMTDNANWVNENFNNFGSQVTSAVVFGHAFPDPTGGDRQQFGQDFVIAAQNFGKPVLYIMGDEHHWHVDQPYDDAPNVTRVTVDQGVPSVRVTITHNSSNPFSFDQSPLVVKSDVAPKPGAQQLDQDQLASVVDEAILRLSSSDVADALAAVDFHIVDLPGDLLGRTSGSTVQIDTDAARYGWFVDETPGDDTEFAYDAATNQLVAASDGAASGRVDLLTAVMHELGHVLGFEHTDDDGLMDGSLPLGIRRLPDESFKDEESRSWTNVLLAGDVNNDGSVTVGDALRIINELSRREFSDITSGVLHDPDAVALWPGLYFDQNGDDLVTSIDALRVINGLARQDLSKLKGVVASSITTGERQLSALGHQHRSVPTLQSAENSSIVELPNKLIADHAFKTSGRRSPNAEKLERHDTVRLVDQMLSDDSLFDWLT